MNKYVTDQLQYIPNANSQLIRSGDNEYKQTATLDAMALLITKVNSRHRSLNKAHLCVQSLPIGQSLRYNWKNFRDVVGKHYTYYRNLTNKRVEQLAV